MRGGIQSQENSLPIKLKRIKGKIQCSLKLLYLLLQHKKIAVVGATGLFPVVQSSGTLDARM